MYIPKRERVPDYDIIVQVLKNAFVNATRQRDRSPICYIMLRACIMAWKELGEGYNDMSDIKQILNDVIDEFTHRTNQEVKRLREKYGDVDDPIKLPEKPKKSGLVDQDGKPLSE